MSFYSPDIYREVARHWTGYGITYLMLLIALSWLPSSIRWFVQLNQFAATGAHALAIQVPAITVRNGIMTTQPGGRHLIHDPTSTGDVIAIVDDSIEAVPAETVKVDTLVLTKHEIGTIRQSTGERRTWKLTPAADTTVTPQSVEAFLRSLPFWVPFVGYAASFAGTLCVATLQILFYGFLGQIMAKRAKVDLDYASLVRIAAIAITPVMVVRTFIGPWEPIWILRWPLAAAVTVSYVAFGIRAATQNTKT